jgi:microcystin-dependent protein
MPKPKPQYLENGDPELMDPNELEMASGQNTQDPRLAFDPHVYQDPDGSISNPLDDWMVAQDLAKRGAGLNYGPKTPTPSPASVAAQPKGYEPPPQMTKYSQALTGRLDDQGQPVPYDPKDITTGPPQMKEPKWWQRALAIGAGGAAGFANAMGKRAPAIDVGSMGENILHPGYGEQMSEWKQRVAPLQAAAQIAQNQQQFAGQQQLNQSMIERNKAQGQYYSGQGRGSMLVTQAISDASGGKLPVGTTQPYQVVDQVLGQNKGMMLVDDDTAAMTGLKSGSNYPTSVVTARLKARSAPNAITVALNKARIDPNNLPDENDPRWANVQVGAGKPMSADDKARAIFSKPEAQWTPEDQAFITGYKKVNDLTKVQPGVARMEVLGQTREYPVLDTQNGNSPAFLNAADINTANKQQPGRYMPAGPAAPALQKTALIEDIRGNVQAVRGNLQAMPDFNGMDKAKIALALRSRDPRGSISALISGGAAGALNPAQQDYLVNTALLIENAMAMRSVLGAGQGSEDLRSAIQATIPGPTTPNREYALKQLGQFEKVLNRLERGVPKVQLRNDVGAGQGGGQRGGNISVTAPDGSVHPFDTLEQANAFKKLAGIK